MRKTSLFVLLGVILLTMIACESESKLDLDKELKFSKLSVEKQKEKIESNGIEFVNIVEGVQNTKAMTAMTHMLNISGTEILGAPMQKLNAGLKNHGNNAFSDFDRQMRVSYIDNDVWGEYVYNFTTGELEQTKVLTNKLILRFPSTENGTKNNVEITVNYEESNFTMPDSDDLYPSKITYTMNIDSKGVMSAEFSGKYHSDGTPQKATASISIEDYKWTIETSNDKKTASASYEFKKGSKTYMKSVGEVSGTLTNDEFKGVEDYDDYSSNPDITSFAVSIQVMNLAVRGGTNDFKSFSDAAQLVEDNDGLSEKQAMDQMATLVNKYMVCTAYFVDDNKKFADIEFYVDEEWEENYDYWEDKYITEIEYVLAPRFILSDGSKVNADDFFQTGFDNLLTKMEELMGEY